MPWAIVSMILQTLASSGLTGEKVTGYLAFLSGVFGRGAPTEQELKDLKALVEKMVAEDRVPTEAEWAEWRARSDAAHERIQSG